MSLSKCLFALLVFFSPLSFASNEVSTLPASDVLPTGAPPLAENAVRAGKVSVSGGLDMLTWTELKPVNLSIEYFVDDGLSVTANYRHYENESALLSTGTGVEIGKWRFDDYRAEMMKYFYRSGPWAIYGGGGISYSKFASESWSTQTDLSSVALIGKLGIKYFFNSHLYAGVELSGNVGDLSFGSGAKRQSSNELQSLIGWTF